MRLRLTLMLVIFGLLAGLSGVRAEQPNPDAAATQADKTMMRRYLFHQIDQAAARWEADYETLTTPEKIAAYQKEYRQRLLDSMGGLPERSPLNAKITGTIKREGYTVEKVIFESQPHLYLTGLLFLPDPARFKPPYPGVVEPCGHYGNSKAWETYQMMGALLALNGMVAFVHDPIDQIERLQYHGERGPYVVGKDGPELDGILGHQMIGTGCILLGRSLTRFMLWDTMRAIDYLQSRPEVDPQRIGCTGQSGGGILTAYTMALDDRVQAAAPVCYLNNLPDTLKTSEAGCSEHHCFAALTAGPQQADLLLLRAPMPTLVCEGTKDFFPIKSSWAVFRCAKRLYTRLGYPERIDIVENDAAHNFDRPLREAVARWMSRWLLHKDEPIVEPSIVLLTDKEALCTPDGVVMNLPGARSVYDLNDDYENELAPRRVAAWAAKDRSALLERVRQIAGIRKLEQLPAPQVEKGKTQKRSGYRIESLELRPEEGIVLPASLWVPEKKPADRVIVYVHERGNEADAAPGGPIEKLVLGGARVLAVELRGTGRSQRAPNNAFGIGIGFDWDEVCDAYLLGKFYMGMRAEDVLVAARYAKEHLTGGPAAAVDLMAVGNVGVPALHAAALEPALFSSVKLSGTLVSWASVVQCHLSRNQYVNIVHGALQEYDLPNLASVLGDKLTIEDARDGAGKPIAKK